ncbi:MAG: hypothetical protein FWG82_04880 [Oscillospiraceae bacterium]|nr:hypothetical protein [Oscillospiraceae bacterium]
MENSMQDIISRYSRELLEYGRQHGKAVAAKPAATAKSATYPMQNSQTPSTQQMPAVQQTPMVQPPTVQQTPMVQPSTVQQTPMIQPPMVQQIPMVQPPVAQQAPVPQRSSTLYEDFQAASNAKPQERVRFEVSTQEGDRENGAIANISNAPQAQLFQDAGTKMQEKGIGAATQMNTPSQPRTPQPIKSESLPLTPASRAARGKGWLKLQVYQSEARFPLEGARAVIFNSAGGKYNVIYDKVTDALGQIEPLSLPAPHREFNLSPEGAAGKHTMPCTVYSLYVEHPGFMRKIYPEISVFDGVDSVKPVILTPKSAGMADKMPIIDFYA